MRGASKFGLTIYTSCEEKARKGKEEVEEEKTEKRGIRGEFKYKGKKKKKTKKRET